MHLRTAKKSANDVYLNDPIGTDKEGNQITLQDKLSDEGYTMDEEIALNSQKQILAGAVNTLSEPERVIIEERYGLVGREEATQREIASRFDISRSYVSRIEKKALKKLGKELGKQGVTEFH